MRNTLMLLLVTAALAGCSSGDDVPIDDTDPDGGADGPSSDGSSGDGPDATPDGEPDPPSTDAALPTPVMELNATNGSAPVAVSFSLSAVNGTGDAWSLRSAFGGNVTELAAGTTLPTTFEHVFVEAGIHDVTFSILANRTVSVSRSIDVATAADAGPIDLVTTQTISGTFDAGAVDDRTETFQVPEGAHAVSAWVTWALPEIGEGIVVTDVDASLQVDGAEVASAGSGSYEWLHHKDDAGIASGEYSVVLTPFATGVETPYTIHVMVWMAPVTETTYGGALEGELAAATENTVSHTMELAGPVHAMSAHLQWGSPDSPSCGTANAKGADLDLSVASGGELFSSGNFGSCEYGSKDAALGQSIAEGSIDFIITPYEAPATEYLLTVWHV